MIDPHAKRVAVPRSFLGISTEYWALPRYERQLRVFERVLSQLRARGDGPFVLRVGGDSADHTFWEPRMRRQPRWVFGVTPRWLSRTRVLVRQTGVRLIIDLNLLTDSPFTAARWVSAAYRALPHGSIAGFEIGNEPDIYSRLYWLAIVSRAGFGARILPEAHISRPIRGGLHLLRADDRPDSARCSLARTRAGESLARRVLAAEACSRQRDPDSASPPRTGIRSLPASRPRSPVYPTIPRILSERASAGHGKRASAESCTSRTGRGFRFA